MQFTTPVPVEWIADFINAEIVGDKNAKATGINEIHNVQEGDLVFVDHPKYYAKCLNSNATFIIINTQTEVPPGKVLLIVAELFEAYLKIVKHFRPFAPSTQLISSSSSTGERTLIMPNVFIGNNVTIGQGCIIHPNVTIYDDCIIGDNVVIHSVSKPLSVILMF